MATVVNVDEMRKAFERLNWGSLNLAEVGDWLKNTGINPGDLLLFCHTLEQNPDGMDDSKLVLKTQASLPYIEEFLKLKGVLF